MIDLLWSDFARMCEAIQNRKSSNEKGAILKTSNLIDEAKQILSLKIEPNFIKDKKAIVWIAKIYEVLEEDISQQIKIHGDIGEGIKWYVENSNKSDYTVKQIKHLLEMNCSKIDSNAFSLIKEAFEKMSSNEIKWFIRYWLRKPRNGIDDGIMRKTFGEPKARFQVGILVPPQLSSPLKGIPKIWPLIMEYKYNGIRVQIHRQEDIIILYNRSGKNITKLFPDVIETVRSWDNGNYILDGEIYPIEKGKPAAFRNINVRIHSNDISQAVEKCPVKLVVFDYLFENSPLRERIKLMENIVPEKFRTVRYTNYPDYDSFEKHKNLFYAQAISDGFEGIMLKDANGKYEPAKRSWFKFKPSKIDLDVVITSARYGEGKNQSVFSSFDVSVKDEGNFVDVGTVGVGFSEEDLKILTNKLRRTIIKFDDGTYEFLPRIVLSVSADLITKNSKGLWGLRFPRMVAIRDDKPVSEINTIEDVVSYVR